MFNEKLVRERIRDIPDYPKKGVNFKDITTLLRDSEAFKLSMEELASRLSGKKVDYIVGIEARGFIIGSALAYLMQKGFIPIRKKGKLPAETVRREYMLEYGTETMEMHKDALKPNDCVIVVDDVLATGGTARAAAELVEQVGASVSAIGFLVEISQLNGKEKLKDYEVISLIKY